jgi:hypothetical protein
VDASSHPIAPVLADRYYWASPNPPSDEAWAFAFSCKKKWKEKIKGDASKIAGVERKFREVFFVTSQFVRDKDRAALEGSLTKSYGFEVHILDRGWILARVLERHHEGIAIDTLGIQGARREQRVLGPRDAQRQRELDETLARIHHLSGIAGTDYGQALENLDAAILARNLGKPRHEVDGFFAIARRLAMRTGNRSLILRCGYQHAWAAFWWNDDSTILKEIYPEIEQHLAGTFDVDDCELMFNLWHLLFSLVQSEEATAEEVQLVERRERIRIELQRLGGEKHRPGSALQARTCIAFLRISEGVDEKVLGAVIRELRDCLMECHGLPTYPAMQVVKLIQAIAYVFEGHVEYDGLFQAMCELVRRREGDTADGQLLYERGFSLLKMSRPKEALSYLGKAKSRLYKEETLQAATRVCLGTALAYAEIGYIWASRMEALAAAHAAFRLEEGTIAFPWEAFWASANLARADLYLGRLRGFLAWFEMALTVFCQIKAHGNKSRGLRRELQALDVLLAVRLLDMESHIAESFKSIINSLAQLQLTMARSALLFRLGKFDQVLSDFPKAWAKDKEELVVFFENVKHSVEGESPPVIDVPPDSPKFIYCTSLLGVRYQFNVQNRPGPALLAENLLGILEAALALAKWENLALVSDRFELLIAEDPQGANPPEIDFIHPSGKYGYPLIWKSDMLLWLVDRGERKDVGSFFHNFLFSLLLSVTIDPMQDLEREFSQWANDEVFSRALSFSPTCTVVENLIGDKWYGLDHWRQAAIAPVV